MSSLISRVATPAQIAILLPMMEAFNALEQVPWNAELKERALRTLLHSLPLGVVGLLHEDEHTVGYFVVTWGFDLEWDGRDAFLTELYLVPEARGRGLGRLALQELEALSREHGARALHLMYRTENVVAERLYLGHGYTSPPRVFLTKVL
ncbi:MAG TPA: GNAT family N-acetyltransferase [Polyangiaceae bacterium]|nr:GNAT family N-acetyltransferase [Polyangiaceae bacterium]